MRINQEVSIDLKYLIGVVQDAFYASEKFRKKAKKKEPWERTWIHHLSDQEDGNWGAVRDICRVMNLNIDRLVSIARLTRKWEIRHNWERCFPVDSHSKQILKFVLINK